MTVQEYLTTELRSFGVSASELADFGMTLPLEEEYTAGNSERVRKALAEALPAFILKPRLNNVSESGFSVSWNFDNLVKYYLWLCRALGITPDETVMTTAGLSSITDKSNLW